MAVRGGLGLTVASWLRIGLVLMWFRRFLTRGRRCLWSFVGCWRIGVAGRGLSSCG